MLSVKDFAFGDLRGGIYDFPFKGDVLPKHNHTEADAHITILIRGKLRAHSHDWEKVILPGQIVDFPAGQPHELTALEDDTRIINIRKKARAPDPE